jgi:hypothetical protein
MEAQAGQFLLDWNCPMSRGIVVQQHHIGDIPAAFSLIISFNRTSRDE